MDFIQSLPYETLFQIFSTLSSVELGQIAQVSHRFHDISLPLLYNWPRLTTAYRATRRSMNSGRTAYPPSLHRFLYALLTPGNQNIGRHVRSLDLDWTHPIIPPIGPIHGRPLSDSDLRSPRPSSRSLAAQLPDAQIVILLLRLPRLQALNVTHRAADNSFDYFMKQYHSALPRSLFARAFQSLRDFHFSAYWSGSINCQTLLILLTLPSIRSISVPVQDHSDDVFVEVCPIGTSTATDLRLSYAFVTPSHLSHILQIPRALTTLTYNQLDGTLLQIQQSLKGGLDAIRNTLQYLSIDIGYVRDYEADDDRGEEGDDEADPILGNLREWPVLRTVRCPPMLLLGLGFREDTPRLVDVLPRGIRCLHIMDDNWHSEEWAIDELIHLLALKEEMLPLLQRVKIDSIDGDAPDNLIEAFEAAGVVLDEEYWEW